MMTIIPYGPNAFAKEVVTVSSTSTALTSTTYLDKGVASFLDRQPARSAYITVEDAAVRYWLNGDAPEATVGHKLSPGDALWLDSPHAIANVRFIRTASTDAKLYVTYCR
jgi:hypothetical protein